MGNTRASMSGTSNKYGSHAFFYKFYRLRGESEGLYHIMQHLRNAFVALLLGLIGFSVSAQAQWWDSSKSEEAIGLSAQLGLNLSKFTHVDRWSGIKPGVNVGIIAEKPILNSLAVKAGLLYTMKGSVGNNDGGFGGNLKTTFSPAYLEIPVLASYRMQYNDNIRITFDLGPYFAFGLHGKDTKKYSGSSVANDTKTECNLFTDQLKRFDFGLQFGPSVVFKNKFSAGMIFDAGLADISNMGGKVGNFSFMINLGYKFLIF